MFLSLQPIDWLVEGHERKFNVSKPFYENTDKTFRIFVNKVNRVSPTVFAGYIEIFLGDFCIVSESYPIIHVDAFVKGITENLIPKSDFDDYLIVRGCGCLGCCEGLFWDLKHEGEDIIISNIRWTRGLKYPVEKSFEREIRVKLEDYKDEVLKLKEFINVL